MTVVAADPEQLRRAAEQVRFAAQELSRSVAARGGELAVPATGGWRSPGELGAAAGAWVEHLDRLADAIQAMAVDLQAVAATLAAADDAAVVRPGSGGFSRMPAPAARRSPAVSR